MNMKQPNCYTRAFTLRAFAALAVMGALAWTSQAAAAEIGELNIGGGIRTSFVTGDDGANDAFDFNTESMRLYTSIQANDLTHVEFNTEFNQYGAGLVSVLDAVIKLSFSEKVNIWLGRHLPPSDRSNLSGPYFLGNWEFPGLVQRYPAIFAGRDNGVQFWGRTEIAGGAMLKYQIGLYEGNDVTLDGSDGPLIAARVTLNLLDNEDGPFNPQVGAYNMSTYYGTADILAIGLTIQTQPDGVTDASNNKSGTFTGFSVDVLYEKKIGDGGALTLEGAFYSYDTDGVSKVDSTVSPVTGLPMPDGFFDNDQGRSEGTGVMALVGFLLPGKIGSGQFRPYFRIQSYTNDLLDPLRPAALAGVGDNPTNIDIGVEYIFTQDDPPFGHQTRATLNISMDDDDAGNETTQILLGMQVQF